MICWNCKHYIRPKPIMFGLGQTQDDCKLLIPIEQVEKLGSCAYYKQSFWKKFWDRVTEPV